MAYRKVPKLDISEEKLRGCETLRGYLILKLTQLAIPYMEFSETLGYQSTTILTRMLKGEVDYGIRDESMDDVLVSFQEYHEAVGLPEMSAQEIAHFSVLNSKLPQPEPINLTKQVNHALKPNPNIGRERLLGAKTLTGFIGAKRRQLGATQKEISAVIGTKYTAEKFQKRKAPLPEDAFDRLISFFKKKSKEIDSATDFDDVELDKLTALNNDLKESCRRNLPTRPPLPPFVTEAESLGVVGSHDVALFR